MPKKSIDVEAQRVSFVFGEGEAAETVVASLSDLPQEIIVQLALHGLSQKGGDSYAGAKAATAELDIEPEAWAKGQVESVLEQLRAGNWAVRTGGGGAQVTDLARAIAEATGEAVESCVERVAESDKETKAALRKHPEIAPILARMRRERAEAKEAQLAKAAENAEGPSLRESLGL